MSTKSANQPVPVVRGENPLRSLQSGIDRLFSDFFDDLSFPGLERFVNPAFDLRPAIDIRQKNDTYTIAAELPGLEPKDIEVTVADGYLTLSGQKAEESEMHDGDVVRRERTFGSFRRLIALPKDADDKAAEATMRNGILTVQLPRRAALAGEQRKLDIRQVA